MKLSTRGRYGMRAMVELAMHYGDGSVLLRDISRRQDVSLKYLEQLVTPLRAAGLVRGVRGARGGYTLSKDPNDIPVGEIIYALEGSPAPVACLDKDSSECGFSCKCATQELWQEIYDSINDIFQSKSLKDLADRQLEIQRDQSKQFIFVI